MNAPGAPQASVRLCGRLEVRFDGEGAPREIPAGQCQTLFAYLVLHRDRVVSRDELVGALWPDRPPSDPPAVLSTLLSRVRTAVRPATIEGRSQLSIVLPDPSLVDVEDAVRAADEARAAAAGARWEHAARQARRALQALDDELLPGFDAPWVNEVRGTLEEKALQALECLAESGVAGRGEEAAAEQAARSLVARAPFRETGHRLLMHLLVGQGNVAEALLVYDRLRNLLREELGIAPSAELQELHRTLLDREPEAPAAPPSALTNLPTELTSFVGREAEIVRLLDQLRDGRTATIVGAGGMGKTRLAVRVAEELRRTARDGVWFVELAPLSMPELVAPSVAATAGVRLDPHRDPLAELTRALGDRRACIVLDNCEHVAAAASAVAAALLSSCPETLVLATSRQPLDFAGERVLALSSLATPAEDATVDEAGSESWDAIALFSERAKAAAPDFRVSAANAQTVARLVRRLDGLPLALELAAALVGRLDVHEIDRRLDERFRLSMPNRPGAPARQSTLLAVVDWSHELLAGVERQLFRRLSVFRGSFSLDAAQEVCADDGDDIVDAVLPLVDKSLVIKEERAGRARYRMLETIRQFASEQLSHLPERQDVERRHRAFFAQLAEDTESRLVSGAEQAELLDALEEDLGNFRVALAAPDGDSAAAALRMAGSLFLLWYVRGHLTEGRRWLEQVLAREGGSPSARAKALITAGELAREQGDYAAARRLLEDGRDLAEQAPPTSGYGSVPFALFNLGLTAQEQGDASRARTLLEQSLGLLENEDGGVFSRAWPLLRLGELALGEGDGAEAHRLVQESLAEHRRRADREGIARALDMLAQVLRHGGDTEAARSLAEQSLSTARDLGYREGLAGPLRTLARLAAAEGEHERAGLLCREALGASIALDSRRGIAAALECAGECAATAGDAVRALQLLGAADALRRDMGAMPAAHLRAQRDQAVARARAALPDSQASAAWSSGYAMTPPEAAAFLAA